MKFVRDCLTQYFRKSENLAQILSGIFENSVETFQNKNNQKIKFWQNLLSIDARNPNQKHGELIATNASKDLSKILFLELLV